MEIRIAFDHQAFVMQSYGGVSRYYSRLAEFLDRQSVHARVFAPIHKNYYLEALPPELYAGKRLEKFPPKTTQLISRYNSLASKRRVKSFSPHLIHETYFSKRIALSGNQPRIVTVYDMIHELFPKSFHRNDKTSLHKEAAIKRADHIICISENTKSDLIDFYNVDAKNVSVVHLAADTRIAQENTNSGANQRNHSPYLLFVGERGGYKNFLGLLNAVAASEKLSSDFSIVAFGGGPFSKEELGTIDLLGFSRSQVLQVAGDDNHLSDFYKRARAFVYPSKYEGFGIPPLESMQNCCPVVCSGSSSIPEVCGNAAEYFDPHSCESMKSTIEKIVYSDSEIERLTLLGNEQITKFSWTKCAEDTLEQYRKLL